MKIRDLSDPVTASKSDWLPDPSGTSTWIGFTPADDSLTAKNKCQSTISRQFHTGYIIEYIAEKFAEPNPGFEDGSRYKAEREAHKNWAGKFIAVHRLRPTSRPLIEILGKEEFELLQDMWARTRNAWIGIEDEFAAAERSKCA
jgi:5-methylcytosine-specific restriction protein A